MDQEATVSHDGYPLHRLNTGHMYTWLCLPIMRRQFASWIAKNYKTGCVLLSPTLRAFATVAPNGQITELAPPHKKFEFWQIANKPSARYAECACRNFYDEETGGPWGNRDKERNADIHHWACQCREVATATWDYAYAAAKARMAEKRAPEARPDERINKALELEGSAPIRSR